MVIKRMPKRTRSSLLRMRSYTSQIRNPITGVIYGSFLVFLGIVMVMVDPLSVITNWFMEFTEGSFVYRMWESPPYELYSEVWIYNYTNVPEYLRGDETVMKLQEVGPFTYKESRTNKNISIDTEGGVMRITPDIRLTFNREKSVGDMKDIRVHVPNIALLALSTLAADKLNYFANAGLYYSISAVSSNLFRNLTAEEFLWGYDDPLVTIASSLFPGWIDFGRIGLLDRFYAAKPIVAEIELRDPIMRFTIKKWDNSEGLREQGFTDLNSSTPCNRIKGTYEGLMVAPNFSKNRMIPVYREQACRVYPFTFKEEISGKYDFSLYRYTMDQSAFNRSSEFACKCSENCLPDGFVDVSNCYYGFPIALSKPHFLDVDPEQFANFEGMKPDTDTHNSMYDIEPVMGIPVRASINMQVNLAVRMSSANTITKPVKDKVLPLIWLSMYCKSPPPEILMLMKMRLVIGPKLIVFLELLLFASGFALGIHSFHRIRKPMTAAVLPKVESVYIKDTELSDMEISGKENSLLKEDSTKDEDDR